MAGKNFIHTVELHFSNKCTGDCICCSKAHGGSNPEFVTERVVDATIRNLQFIEFNWLQLGGDGDSFLNPVFIPSLRKYRQVFPGKGLCLFTNGAMLTKEMTDILTSEKLLDDIQTRLDSLDPELYRQSTGLSLERVIDNIKYFFLQNTFTRYHIIYFPLYAYKHVCREQLGKEQPTHWHRINEDLLHDEAMEMKKFFYSLPRNPRMTEAQMNFRISPICLWGEREDIPPVTDKVCTQLPEYKGCFRNQIYVYPNGDLGCCYDRETEVFTNEGWKYFEELRGDELVLTRKSGGDTEWANIVAQQRFRHKGDMFEIKSQSIDLLVTPKHRFCLESPFEYSSNHAVFDTRSEDGYVWRTIEQFNTSPYRIPKSFNWVGTENRKFTKDFLKLFGWYIAEGCCVTNRTQKGIMIYQTSTKPEFEEIRQVIEDNEFNPIRDTRAWRVYDETLFNYCTEFGKSHEKYIPQEIKNLPADYLETLLLTMIKGDGWEVKDKSGNLLAYRYKTVSEQLANDVQEIAYKCGHIATILKVPGKICSLAKVPKVGRESYVVYISLLNSRDSVSMSYLVVNKKIRKIENFNDYVFDITVDRNHTLWVRRNKEPVWSSNCAYDDAQNTFIVGNVLDHDHAIHDAWASDKRMQIIDDVRRGRYYGKYPCTNPVACGMYFVDKSVNYGSCYERNNTVSKVAR